MITPTMEAIMNYGCKLSKLYSFTESQTYIDTTEAIKVSPDNDKIAVQTSTRRINSLNIIDLNNE